MILFARLISTHRLFATAFAVSAVLLPLTGCGMGSAAPAFPGDAVTLHGVVHGGQAPVDGAVMQLYAVGTGGNGTGATPLITSKVVKSVSGAFTITGDYTCPPLVGGLSPPVYLTATGGNPGLTPAVNNTALALVVALGPCNTLYANAATTTININEVTTAAAAWALAPFANVSGAANDSSYSSIASSGTNLAGITNAMLTAQQLADPTTGVSPGSSAPVGSIMESAKLNTLADILASCVNSTGADTNCSGLFTDVKPAAAKPSDTFGAALSIVKNPANNVSNIYMNHLGTSPPFPALSSAPNDWTMSITYSGSTGPFANFSLAAFDAQGNFWGFYNDAGATIGNLTELNRQYTPVLSVPLEPYTDGNYYTTAALAIDGSQHIWITSEENSNATGTVVNYKGSVLEFDASGNLLSGAPGYMSGGILDPRAIAADSNGSVWVGSNGVTTNNAGVVTRPGGDVTLFNSTGTALSPSGGFANFSDFDPGPIVFDGNHTAWCANDILDDSANGSNVGQYLVSITAPTITNPTPTVTRIYFPNAYSSTIGVDTNNNIWFTSGADMTTSGFNQLGVVNTSGTLVTSTLAGGGLINATGMVIDPANNIWIANANESQQGYTSNDFADPVTISQFSAASTSFGTALSPTQGYGTDPNLSSSFLTGLLIDSSGSLWVAAGPTETYQGLTYTLDGLTTFVGLATPLKTPALGPPQAP